MVTKIQTPVIKSQFHFDNTKYETLCRNINMLLWETCLKMVLQTPKICSLSRKDRFWSLSNSHAQMFAQWKLCNQNTIEIRNDIWWPRKWRKSIRFDKNSVFASMQRKQEYGATSVNDKTRVQEIITAFDNYQNTLSRDPDRLNSYNLGSYFINISLSSTKGTQALVADHIAVVFDIFVTVNDNIIGSIP